MTRWATAGELRERLAASFQLYVDAVVAEDGRGGMDLWRARKVTAVRNREYLVLLRRFEKAYAREMKPSHKRRPA